MSKIKFEKAKKMSKKTKIIIVSVAGIIVIAGVVIAITVSILASNKSEQSAYKETMVQKGNITSGITESGSATIGTVSQLLDLDDISVSVSTTGALTTSSDSSGTSSSSSGTSSGSSTGSTGTSFGSTGSSSNLASGNLSGASSGSSSGSSSSSAKSGTGSSSTSGTGTNNASSGGSGSTSSTGTSSGTATSGSSSNSGVTNSTDDVSLEVKKVYATAGQIVKKGDPILKISKDSIDEYKQTLKDAVITAELNLKQAQISYKEALLEANYTYNSSVASGSVAASQYSSTITQLNNAVTSAEQSIEECESNIKTYKKQLAKGQDVQSKIDQEETNLKTAQAALKQARNNLQTQSVSAKQTYEEAILSSSTAKDVKEINTNGISDDVDDATDTLKEANEALNNFDDFIGNGNICAKYSGTIMTVGYSQGDTISSDTAVATYADSDEVTMTVSVSQEDISNVSIGDEVEITLTAYEDETFKGTVQSMETTSTTGSSTVNYSVTVLFTGDTSKVFSGMTGDVTFITKQVKDVLYISDKAIINEGTKTYVKIKDGNGNIKKTKVTTGFSNGVNVEIQSGLKEGQTVIIESQVTN